MSIIILGKLFVGGLSAVGFSSCIYFGGQWWLDTEVSFYGMTDDVDKKSEDAMKFASDEKNFKCKIGENQFDCNIEEIKFNDKKHTTISNPVSSEHESNNTIKLADTQAAGKVFRITAKKSQLSEWKNQEQLEIVQVEMKDKTITDDKTHYAKMTNLFFTFQSDEFVGKANYFVAKAPKAISDTGGYKCAWTEDSPQFKDCEIYKFSDTDPADGSASAETTYAGLTFKKPETENKVMTIEINKHYLIKFTEEGAADQNNLNKNSMVFVKAGDPKEVVKFDNIKPSILVKDEKLIIFGEK